MKTYPTLLPIAGSASCRIVEMTAERRGQTEEYCDTYAVWRAAELRMYPGTQPRRMPQNSVLAILRKVVNGAIEMGWISDEEARVLLYGTNLSPDCVIRGYSGAVVILDEIKV